MQYTGTGGVTVFAYPFKILEDDDLLVIVSNDATMAETILTLNADYTVSGAGSGSGGNVTLSTAGLCESGQTLMILRNMAATQTTDYVDGEAFSAESLESALDKMTLIQQQQKEEIGRTPKLPKTSTITDIALPNPSANNYLGWNAGATGLANLSGPVITTATQYEVDALITYGGGTSYTQATIQAALTAIGTTTKVTLLLRPGTWVISSNADWSASTNVIFKLPPGTVISHGSYTVNIPNPECGLYQVFSGTGVVTISGNVREGYPEWWGIDGTADDVQINAALNAVQTVRLQAKRYYIASPVSPLSNNRLLGAGRDVTYLDYSGGVLGDQTCKVAILNKTNVIVQDLTIDGQSADGTVHTGSGFLVDDGSSNVVLNNIHIYDAYFHGLIINTGSDIHVSNLKVSNGCASSAILIGQFPATYGLAVNKDLVDVTLSDIFIYNVNSDGLGIWNCSGGDGYSSIAARVNRNNLIVRKWGRTGLGYAYWGSGITTFPKDVNLNNFNFDNTGAGTSNIGRGLHIEFGERWNHTNGNIYNLITGSADDKLGYAITASGGQNLTYSNINIQYCGIGVLANGSSDAFFTNIHVKYSKYVAYYVGGSKLKFTNCTDFTTGAYTTIQASWLIFAEVPLSVDQLTLDHCTGYVATPVGTAYPITISATAFHDMTITNFRTDQSLAISPGAHHPEIHGNTLSVKLREAVTAGTDYELPVLNAPLAAGGRIFILNAYLSFGSGIAVNPTDYNTYKLYRRDSSGAAPEALTTGGLVTKTDSFATALKSNSFSIDAPAAAHLGVGYTLSLVKTHGGAGKAEADGILTIEYFTY